MFNVKEFFDAFECEIHQLNDTVFRDEVEKLLLQLHAPLAMRKHLPELPYRACPDEIKAWAVKAAMTPTTKD